MKWTLPYHSTPLVKFTYPKANKCGAGAENLFFHFYEAPTDENDNQYIILPIFQHCKS